MENWLNVGINNFRFVYLLLFRQSCLNLRCLISWPSLNCNFRLGRIYLEHICVVWHECLKFVLLNECWKLISSAIVLFISPGISFKLLHILLVYRRVALLYKWQSVMLHRTNFDCCCDNSCLWSNCCFIIISILAMISFNIFKKWDQTLLDF